MTLAVCMKGHNVMASAKQFVVVLDAGHGGKDPGAIGSKRSNNEKTINLNVVKDIGQLLQANCPDIKVLYTRKTDVFVPLDQRANIANKAKADLFISVHVNSLPKNAKKAKGVQSYTLTLRTAGTNLEVEKRENSVIQFEADGASKYSFANPNSAESDIMFELMQDRDMKESVAFAEMAQKEMVRTGGRNDMGVLQANLAVLRLTYMPSVLLEIGYISTPAEEAFLITRSGQQTIARSIYNAIRKYKNRHNRGSVEPVAKQTVTQPAEPVVEQTETKPAEKAKQQVEEVSTAVAQVEMTTQAHEEEKTEQPTQKPAEQTKPLYRVQIMSAGKKVRTNDRQFKGLKVDVHQEGGLYKYTYGAVSTLQEAKNLRKSILDRFPNAFIVQY